MKVCKYCGEELPFPRRDDSGYCDNSTCRSKYHQEIGRGYRGEINHHMIHEDKPWIHPYTCEVCGIGFDVNDYAKRKGKRKPLYCSGACKQKAYRSRHKKSKR